MLSRPVPEWGWLTAVAPRSGTGTMLAGCRSINRALDFGVRVALSTAASGPIGQASRDQERQMTLTLRLQDGAC
jgi:hypothetical protein